MKGNMHDKKLYDQQRAYTTIRVKRKADLAYLSTSCDTPFKKPRKGSLSDTQKAYNKKFNGERVIVEHAIAKLKEYRILSYRFRNALTTYNLIFKNMAGLVNLQMAQ